MDMEYNGGVTGGVLVSGSNVPAFLTKLWTLVEDPETDSLICWSPVVHIEQGGLVKPEKDDTEFQHPYFIRGQELLLENIKRKVTNVSNIKHEDLKIGQDGVSKLLSDVQLMRGKQEAMDSKIIAMKQ
ncbi:hypothetical protein JZ751_000253 [Albula glossodonta]|uniref:HSF-type DNA-binding domain-containing protein n=1 Tax=Albula glossodonta TaxID=121402 RepID=A0A8T2PVQ5_9TELE|nr:hypothetical protein JZ751_000253 [Albula glossodonta]